MVRSDVFGGRVTLPDIGGHIYRLSGIGKPRLQNLVRLNETLIYGRFK